MAYSTQAQLAAAAGGAAALAELADNDGNGQVDAAVLAQAQAAADAEIDAKARRLWGSALPFDPIPDVISALAAEETVYRLRMYKRMLGEIDERLRAERLALLDKLEAGTLMPPPADTYPIGSGGGAPVVRSRSIDDRTSDNEYRPSRATLKGFW